MKTDKNNLSGARLSLIMREAFYFFTALLIVGAVMEVVFPGLFSLFVNAAVVLAGWLVSLSLTIFYVRR